MSTVLVNHKGEVKIGKIPRCDEYGWQLTELCKLIKSAAIVLETAV